MCVCLCSSGKEWSSGEAAAHPIHPHSRAHHLLARGGELYWESSATCLLTVGSE